MTRFMDKCVIRDFCALLAVSCGLSSRRKAIAQILDIFLDGLDTRLLSRNQKFDFSLSFKKKPERAFRFSYNNFGEKNGFANKITRALGLFGAAYDLSAARAILCFAKRTDAKHQTTIGLEWPRKNARPRFKVYFEELHHRYSRREARTFLRRLCAIAGFDFQKIAPPAQEQVAAIAIDFLPGGAKNIKTYSIFKSPTFLKASLAKEADGAFGAKLQAFDDALSLEHKGFYYLTRRFHKSSGLSSIKVYKIYEVRQISDFHGAFTEINGLLAGLQPAMPPGAWRAIRRFCADHNLCMYPVIASLDMPLNADIKVDVYISLKKISTSPLCQEKNNAFKP